MNTATPSPSLATVPINVKFGCCGTAGGAGCGRGAAAGTLATAGAGGRRDGVDSGRVRVAASAFSGIAQSGLALTVGVAAGFAVTSGGGTAGRVTSRRRLSAAGLGGSVAARAG